MTMNLHQHPDDERLAALAGGEPEAAGDDELRGHVAGCSRCDDLVGELATMRVTLAELPDLIPERPLELRLPEPRVGLVERLAAFSQRAFAPAMGVAGALLLVGVIGTGAGMADQFTAGPAAEPAPAMEPETDANDFSTREDAEPGVAGDEDGAPAEPEVGTLSRVAAETPQALVEIWPWNALLGAGVGLMILALVLRFGLRTRADP
jgi:hypothetical protein